MHGWNGTVRLTNPYHLCILMCCVPLATYGRLDQRTILKTFLEIYFFLQDMIGFLLSNLGIFLMRGLVLFGFIFIYCRGCNLAAHSSIQTSFISRIRLTRFQLPKGFLGLRKVECRNFSDILEWGPGAILIGNITLKVANHF